MTAPFSVIPFDRSLDRASFNSGQPLLDRYFSEQVTQDAKRRLSKCFVAVSSSGEVVGYYTLSAMSIALTDIEENLQKKLPRYPLLPAALLGRLAVSKQFQGKGLGGALVIDAAMRLDKAPTAVFALLVDAIDQTAVRFYQRIGFTPFESAPQKLYMPLTTLLAAAKAAGMNT